MQFWGLHSNHRRGTCIAEVILLRTINPQDGSRSIVGSMGAGDAIEGLAFETTTGTLFGVGGGYLWTIDTVTAARSNVGFMGAGDAIEAIDFESSSQLLLWCRRWVYLDDQRRNRSTHEHRFIGSWRYDQGSRI